MKIISFGFKWGKPDVDIVFDARRIRNPHQDKKLRKLRGTDAQVANQVLRHRAAIKILREAVEAGKQPHIASIGVGCTGGHHRSVAIAVELGRRLHAHVTHRDINK